MSAMLPMAFFGLEVPCSGMPVPATSDFPAAFRITMAAIDPTAEPEGDDDDIPRATLKIIRIPLDEDQSDDDEDEEFDVNQYDALFAGGEGGNDDETEDEDEDVNGGPSDPAKTKKARKEAAQKEILRLLEEAEDEDDDDEDDDMVDVDGAVKLVNGVKKSAKARGKMPASDDSEDDDDEDEDDEAEELEEFVVCTLDPVKNCQQPLDITVGELERVFFVVSGSHSIFLTGNYVEPADHPRSPSGMYDPDSDEDEDYDLEPDTDELDEDDEEDALDSLANPRIAEIEDEDEEEEEAPQLVKAAKKSEKKGKNKRLAEDYESAAGLESIDEMIAQDVRKDHGNDEKSQSKKQLKKQKKNDGSAAVTATDAAKKEDQLSTKKVQFAKELEQGPTPTKDAKEKPKASLGVKTVQGVIIDDKKLGTGAAAKAGDRVGMRYIGKLKDGKVFDSNKKGKPFSFKLGGGEVIKGWDIGIAGMSAGGERRITIPAHLAYGSKGVPGIPGNATLIFDVKLLEINKGK